MTLLNDVHLKSFLQNTNLQESVVNYVIQSPCLPQNVFNNTLNFSLKLFAMGFVAYFGNAWCWLDFIIVGVSLVNFAASLLGAGNISIFKTMRTLRALRPLRAMAKMEGMRVVVNALVGALPSIFNVLLVCLIFWLIFAIIGVNTFMGRFQKCVDTNTGEKFSHEIIPDREVCLAEKALNRSVDWINPTINFDNVMAAYVALFQVIYKCFRNNFLQSLGNLLRKFYNHYCGLFI